MPMQQLWQQQSKDTRPTVSLYDRRRPENPRSKTDLVLTFSDDIFADRASCPIMPPTLDPPPITRC
jgi:hypothetical protein